jgi:hypothetical protein
MISPTTLYGVVAQLVERYPEEVGVGGSSPSDSATSGYSITVIMPVFQTDDVSSILTTRSFYFALSSNGRTTDFGSVCVGSNPAGATKARAPLIAVADHGRCLTQYIGGETELFTEGFSERVLGT